MNKLTLKIKELLTKGWDIDKICDAVDRGVAQIEEEDAMINDFYRDEKKTNTLQMIFSQSGDKSAFCETIENSIMPHHPKNFFKIKH